MSLRSLYADGFRAVNRFPLGFAYLTALCIWLLCLTWLSKTPSDNVCIAFSYCLPAGLLLSLVIPLWTGFAGRPRLSFPLQAAANALLLADFIFLLMRGQALGMAAWISHISVVSALVVGLLFIPDRRRYDSSWYFSYSQITNLITTAIISLAMWLVAVLIYGTLDLLFNVQSWKLMPTLGIIGALFVPLTIFMGRIPAMESLDTDAAGYTLSRFDRGIIKFLLLPLALIDMGILYVYGVRILVTLMLPVGMVVYPVTGFTAVCLLLLFLLRRAADSPAMHRICRMLPVAMLPLLVLMSVSVLYRIGEYGITVSRLYVLTFNLWAYAAMIYLIATKSRRFTWIPMSFALLFVAVSIIPGANYTSLTYNYMQSRIKAALTEAGATAFPLDRNQVKELRNKISTEEWTLLSSRLEYIDDCDDHSYTSSIVSFPVKTSSWQTDELFDTDLLAVEAVEALVSINIDATEFIPVPQSYKYVSRQGYHHNNIRITDRRAHTVDIGDGIELIVDFDSITALNSAAQMTAIHIPVKGHPISEAMFIPTSVECRFDRQEYADSAKIYYIGISGLLFTTFNISE